MPNFYLIYTDALVLSLNSLTGTIPSEIGVLAQLGRYYCCCLGLCNYFSAHAFLVCPFTEYFDLHVNALTGSIPSEIGLLTDLSKNCCCVK